MRAEGCVISRNSGGYIGGGVHVDEADAKLTNCTISDNETIGDGGGVYCRASDPVFTNCIISQNSSDRGGGVATDWNAHPRFFYCTVSDNNALRAGAIANYWATALYGCIVWGNRPADTLEEDLSATFCDIEGGCPGRGNIDADPRFTSYRDFEYLLEAGSPCIDAGSRRIPDGIQWPSWYRNFSLFSDMGAWGGPGAGGGAVARLEWKGLGEVA